MSSLTLPRVGWDCLGPSSEGGVTSLDPRRGWLQIGTGKVLGSETAACAGLDKGDSVESGLDSALSRKVGVYDVLQNVD